MKKKHLGDLGQTRLFGGQEVSKASWRPRTYGAIDEASSALGLARVHLADERLREFVREAQADLYVLGGELAAEPAEAARFGLGLDEAALERLDLQMKELLAEHPLPNAFVLPGSNLSSATLDLARTIVRRAEREFAAAIESGEAEPGVGFRYLNRLSDLIFVIARHQEGGATELATDRRDGAAERRRSKRSEGA